MIRGLENIVSLMKCDFDEFCTNRNTLFTPGPVLIQISRRRILQMSVFFILQLILRSHASTTAACVFSSRVSSVVSRKYPEGMASALGSSQPPLIHQLTTHQRLYSPRPQPSFLLTLSSLASVFARPHLLLIAANSACLSSLISGAQQQRLTKN